MKKILFIQGSLAQNSKSFLLLKMAMISAESKGFESELLDLRHIDMPFCDGRKLPEYSQDLQAIYDKIQAATYVVFGMPVYCYSISGPLKNFIDIFSHAFENKRFGICAAAGSRMSYLATADLIKILAYESKATGVQPMVLTDYHDYDGDRVVDEKIPSRIDDMLDSLIRCH